MKQSHKGWNNWLLVLAVVALAVTPLIFLRSAKFSGSDDQAQKAISQVKPGYQPWFQPLFVPPSSEIQSLLFASQAALGAGVIGYAIGLYKGRSQQQRDNE